MPASRLLDNWRGGNVELSLTPGLVIDGDGLESIIGVNNFQDPWFLELGHQRSQSVCCIPNLGTAFLISEDIVMTNWHIFRRKEWAENKNVIFKYEK